MKVGQLFKRDAQTVDDIVARILPSAHRAYANRGLSDVQVLALLASNYEQRIAEMKPDYEAAYLARIRAAVANG